MLLDLVFVHFNVLHHYYFNLICQLIKQTNQLFFMGTHIIDAH